jgi:hypothetical protein
LRSTLANFDTKPICPYPIFDNADSLALQFAAKWGHLGKSPWNDDWTRHTPDAIKAHDDFVTLKTLEMTGLTDVERHTVAMGPLVIQDEHSGWPGKYDHTLISLTNMVSDGRISTTSHAPKIMPEHINLEEITPLIIVLGASTSIEDLCLYWNFRAKCMQSPNFPMWIDPDWLQDKYSLSTILTCLKQDHEQYTWDGQSIYPVLMSATVPWESLTRYQNILHNSIVPKFSEYTQLSQASIHIGITRHSVAHFSNGRSKISLPDTRADLQLYESDELGITIKVDNWKQPQVDGPQFAGTSTISRVGIDGTCGILHVDDRSTLDLIDLRVDSAWDSILKLAKSRGYAVEASDKGRLACSVLHLVSDVASLSILASSAVYNLLKDMSRIVGRQAVQNTLSRILAEVSPSQLEQALYGIQTLLSRDGQFDRPYYGFDKIAHALSISKKDSIWLVDWMIRRRLLFRGIEIICSNCGLKRWYPSDRISEIHTCDGCLTSMPFPAPPDKSLAWKYRINELVAQSVDQGILPHLLAIRHYLDSRWRDEDAMLGFHPGLLFTPIDSSDGNPIEADIVIVDNGEIILGECKAMGQEISLDDDIAKLSKLAQSLRASSVIIATPTEFPDTIHSNLDAHPIAAQLMRWERPDMLDPRVHPDASSPAPEEYLRNVVTWYQEHA